MNASSLMSPIDAPFLEPCREMRVGDRPSDGFAVAKLQAIELFERDYLASLMERCRGNLTRAAQEAGLSRTHLRHLLRKRGLYGGPRRATDEP